MSDYIVTLWVPFEIRIENADDEAQAEGIAADHFDDEGVVRRLEEALDDTSFYFYADGSWKAEVEEVFD